MRIHFHCDNCGVYLVFCIYILDSGRGVMRAEQNGDTLLKYCYPKLIKTKDLAFFTSLHPMHQKKMGEKW